ncbi:MAG: hypothetical protein HYV26_14975 [Candidatus Hydrogenedentes bacterium]|nr:hypothetical protein [Candidatus Hydrogenedentota bacterium]
MFEALQYFLIILFVPLALGFAEMYMRVFVPRIPTRYYRWLATGIAGFYLLIGIWRLARFALNCLQNLSTSTGQELWHTGFFSIASLSALPLGAVISLYILLTCSKKLPRYPAAAIEPAPSVVLATFGFISCSYAAILLIVDLWEGGLVSVPWDIENPAITGWQKALGFSLGLILAGVFAHDAVSRYQVSLSCQRAYTVLSAPLRMFLYSMFVGMILTVLDAALVDMYDLVLLIFLAALAVHNFLMLRRVDWDSPVTVRAARELSASPQEPALPA